MELFYSDRVEGDMLSLSAEDAAHCVKVLRHRSGDEIFVTDGAGTLLRCRLEEASPRAATARILERTPGWGGHPYRLEMAVCPTKNADRYEWFLEKATELGVDRIIPVIGDRSERKVFKTERARKILLSAAKQSLKGAVPRLEEACAVRDYLQEAAGAGSVKLICCCFEPEDGVRQSISQALATAGPGAEIRVLIGPEGDFSPEELRLALSAGYRPVHLGASRLRTETAAVTAVAAAYFHYI